MSDKSQQPQASKSKTKSLVAVLVLGVAALAGVYAIAGSDGNKNTKTASTYAVVSESSASTDGAPALDRSLSTGAMATFVFKKDRPELKVGSFKDGNGEVIGVDKWRGRVALINLWATWCGPCRAEMPHLNALQKQYGGDEFEVVALSVDQKGAEASAAFLKEIKADALALYIDETARAMKHFGAFGLPLTVLIDREGREVGRMVGPADWAGPDAKRLIEAAIADKG